VYHKVDCLNGKAFFGVSKELIAKHFSNFHLYSVSENDRKHFFIGICTEKIASSVIYAIGTLLSTCIKLHKPLDGLLLSIIL
jgi:hypothetical protein